jgi:DNA polymerase III sliding clamp (beta) subunit (PCNA family)
MIIPKACACFITLDRSKLLAAFRAASVIARSYADIIRVTLGNDQVVLFASDVETGETEIPVKVDRVTGDIPENNIFSVRAEFVIKALGVVPDETIRLGYNGAPLPVLFTLENRADFQAVIMPMVTRT